VSGAPVFIAGHSLGAARAFLYAWSRIKRGLRVDGIYALASPHPGDHTIAETISVSGPIVRSLVNGRDYVPYLPIDLEEIGEEYVPGAQPWQVINEPPTTPGLKLDAWHAIALYQAAARKLPPTGGAVELGDAADEVACLYVDTAGWDWINPVDGAYCAMKVMPTGARLVVFRGTITAHEWLQDFDAVQIQVMGARVSQGFWAGVAAVEDRLDETLI
jgi:pimeloyl-ACP methyl ester carboxylesterase